MKPVFQTQFLGRKGPGAGNCHAACLASVLELPLDEVPNFQEITDDDACWRAEEDWLKAKGFFSLSTDPLAELDSYAGWHIAMGPNARNGTMHSCVYYGTELRHDPNPEGGGLAEVTYRYFLIPLVPQVTA